MEFKKGSILVTKDGEFTLKRMMTMYNPFSLTPQTVFLVDVDGNERSIMDKDVISVKNNHLNGIEEP